MDVQALDSAMIATPPVDQAMSQNLTNNSPPDPSGIAGASSVAVDSTLTPVTAKTSTTTSTSAVQASQRAATVKAANTTTASDVHSQTASQSSSIHVSYRFVQNPVQVVVVFTDAADGQEVAQVPPEFVVKLVQFDHNKGELVDRDA
jgi:uncharacterized FlaG/YvyC family protein